MSQTSVFFPTSNKQTDRQTDNKITKNVVYHNSAETSSYNAKSPVDH